MRIRPGTAGFTTPRSKRFSDDFASGSPQSGAARERRRKILGMVTREHDLRGKEPQALMRALAHLQGAANFALRRRGVGNSIHIGKPQPRKSTEKNCSETDPHHCRRACRTGIIRTRFCAADFRLNRVIRLANTMAHSKATSLLSQKSAGAKLLAPQSKRFLDDFARAERRQ